MIIKALCPWKSTASRTKENGRRARTTSRKAQENVLKAKERKAKGIPNAKAAPRRPGKQNPMGGVKSVEVLLNNADGNEDQLENEPTHPMDESVLDNRHLKCRVESERPEKRTRIKRVWIDDRVGKTRSAELEYVFHQRKEGDHSVEFGPFGKVCQEYPLWSHSQRWALGRRGS